MITHTHTRGIIVGGRSIARTIAVTGGQEINLNETIPGSSTNLLVAFAATVAKLQSIFLLSTVAMVIKTNSSGSPANTITLTANVPYLWQIGDGTLRDTAGTTIAVDITALYVTNPSEDDAVLEGYILIDPT